MIYMAKRVNHGKRASFAKRQTQRKSFHRIARKRVVHALQKFVETFSADRRNQNRWFGSFRWMCRRFLPFAAFVGRKQIHFVPDMKRRTSSDTQLGKNLVHGFIQFLIMSAGDGTDMHDQ